MIRRLTFVIRSKLPVFIKSSSEENILLGNCRKSYTSTTNDTVETSQIRSDANYELFQSDGEFNEFEDGKNSNQINEWQAAWNVTNAIQGMFVVSLPYAIANGGYWALLAMLLVSYICCYTGKILVDCLYEDDSEINDGFKVNNRYKRVRSSYVDIAKDVWGGDIGARVVNIAQNIELLMTCILYLVLCGDLLVGSFPLWELDHTSWTIISCMILVPCAFIKNLKLVSKLSFCNAIVHLVINAIIMIYCFTKVKSWDFSKVEIRINIWSFPISLGIIVFSYTSQIFLPTLEGSMCDKSKFDSMLYLTHFAAAIFKASFGYIGFLTWQENTDEVITNNLPTIELKILVNMILVVKALLSYPLPYYASVELLETSLFETNRKTPVNNNTFTVKKQFYFPTCYDTEGDLKFWAVCLRIGLIVFTLLLAIFIPHFAILMGLIGSITGTMLSLIWPCYFHISLKWKKLKFYQICIDVIIIIFGLLITVTGVYYSSYALINALKTGHSQNKYYIDNNFYLVNKNISSFLKFNFTLIHHG